MPPSPQARHLAAVKAAATKKANKARAAQAANINGFPPPQPQPAYVPPQPAYVPPVAPKPRPAINKADPFGLGIAGKNDPNAKAKKARALMFEALSKLEDALVAACDVRGGVSAEEDKAFDKYTKAKRMVIELPPNAKPEEQNVARVALRHAARELVGLVIV